MKQPLTLVAALLLSSALAGGSATAPTSQVLTGRPATLANALKDAGYTPELLEEDGEPLLHLMIGDRHVDLYFFDCKADVCARVNATSSVDPADEDHAGQRTERIAAWNTEYFTQAYQDEDGAAYLDDGYMLTGGFTRANFLAWFKAYLTDLGDFTEELGS